MAHPIRVTCLPASWSTLGAQKLFWSVTVYETNWIQTIPGEHWFSYMRFYGPLEPYFDHTWKLGDFTPVA